MDNYFEQNVAGARGPQEQLKYALCCAGIAVFALAAIVGATGIVLIGEEGITINWPSLAMLLIGAAVAVLLFVQKDKVYVEYDYILWNSEFEVCAVYNRKRRKKLTTISLNKVSAWGPASAMEKQMHNAKRTKLCPREEGAWCLVYAEDDGKKAALLDLSEEMCAQLRNADRMMRTSEVRS